MMNLNPWLMFFAGYLLCLIIQMIGYAFYVSQKHAEDVDTRIKLHVYAYDSIGGYDCTTYPVRDQDEAQRTLNEYMFSAIRSAHVSDPIDGRTLAKMDSTGRLIGV